MLTRQNQKEERSRCSIQGKGSLGSLLRLSPYSPEPSPVEHIWNDLREKSFYNLVFYSLDSLEDHLEEALRNIKNDQQRVRSIVT
jgi:transposase